MLIIAVHLIVAFVYYFSITLLYFLYTKHHAKEPFDSTSLCALVESIQKIALSKFEQSLQVFQKH